MRPLGDIALGLRIEWCKARARAARWSEEVLLLIEEMRRVIEFFWWQSHWWKERGAVVVVFCSAYYQEGALAYAERQACLRLMMATNHCQPLWIDVPKIVTSQLLPDDYDGDDDDDIPTDVYIDGPPPDEIEN
ncbi:hypothetical protein EDB19DRAFT_2024011 [Suillus lakei]|nr:hypothetical protein EDB19DRAFT_2024011 [Suillus lakei]